MELIIVLLIVAAILAGIYWRLRVTNLSPVTLENVEKRLGARAALQFALDHGLPLKTSAGETDGFNAWNVTCARGLRVAGDLTGGKRR